MENVYQLWLVNSEGQHICCDYEGTLEVCERLQRARMAGSWAIILKRDQGTQDNSGHGLFALYSQALNQYGLEAQKWVLIEECGELLNALAKLKRDRTNKDDVINELADVHIMVEQMAYYYGLEDFLAEKGKKLARLKTRLSK